MASAPHRVAGTAALIVTRAAPWVWLPLAHEKTLHSAKTVLSTWSLFNIEWLFLTLYWHLPLATGAVSAR